MRIATHRTAELDTEVRALDATRRREELVRRIGAPLIERETKEKPLKDAKRELAQAAYEATMTLIDFRAEPR